MLLVQREVLSSFIQQWFNLLPMEGTHVFTSSSACVNVFMCLQEHLLERCSRS